MDGRQSGVQKDRLGNFQGNSKVSESKVRDFGLFTEIAVCTFLCGWWSYGLKPFLFCPLYVFIHIFAAFCTAHCALDLARDHVP